MTMLRENYAEFQESRMLPRGREVEIGVRISLSTPVPVHAAASGVHPCRTMEYIMLILRNRGVEEE